MRLGRSNGWGWLFAIGCLCIACNGRMRNLGDDLFDENDSEPTETGGASSASTSGSTVIPASGGATSSPVPSSGGNASGGGIASSGGPDGASSNPDVSAMDCEQLASAYATAAIQASSCVANASYTQCVGIRLVGLECACPMVIHYPQTDALNLLTAIEVAWVKRSCGWPSANCTCKKVTISSAWGGCNPTTGRCASREQCDVPPEPGCF